MAWTIAVIALFLSSGIVSLAEEPSGIRERFLGQLKSELNRLPDFVCTQTVDRFGRVSAEKQWDEIDTLRFETAFIGEQEFYALPGSRRFESRPLATLIARGTISNGQLALLARHVFLTSTADFTYRGETEQAGRPAYEYSYDVPVDRSSYHLRAGSVEGKTAFQGIFWVDKENLDLLRLQVQAYDIPDTLGILEADTALEYSRFDIDGIDILLPRSATLTVVATDGGANMNRTRFSDWRRYRAESTIQFASDEAPARAGAAERVFPSNAPASLPKGAVIDLALDDGLDPAAAKLGDIITATVSRPLQQAQNVLVSQGTIVQGRVVRIEKKTMPFPIYEVGLQFDNLALGERNVSFTATMQEAGPAAGLVRQSKHLDPTFVKKRAAHIDILVPEIQRGQGILEWDARKGPIPRGLRMKWRVDGDSFADARP